MKLDRNINPNRMGKYALLKLRKLDEYRDGGAFAEIPSDVAVALATLEAEGILDWGDRPDTEFFVIRLKDKFAAEALKAYANEARYDDREYADEIEEMASRSGPNNPFCKVQVPHE